MSYFTGYIPIYVIYTHKDNCNILSKDFSYHYLQKGLLVIRYWVLLSLKD